MKAISLDSVIPSEKLSDYPGIGFNNRGFINGNFLRHFQKDNSIKWHRFDEAKVNLAFRELMKIYAESKSSMRPESNEGELEAELIIPVLTKVLGFSRRKKKFTPPGTSIMIEPDHLLFHSAILSDRFLVDAGQMKRDLRSLVSISESKSWNKNLDMRESGRDTSPVEQMMRDMRFTGAQYGILTNGKEWRLYTREGLQTPGVFFEIDLPLICEDQNTELFEIFYNLFSLDALNEESAGSSHIKYLLKTAASFGHDLESNLRVRMYTAMEFLTNGFRESDSNETLASHYESAMYIMYRILFALKAEDSNLLPIRDTDNYSSISLRKMCEKSESLVEDWNNEKRLNEKEGTDLFASLKNLSKAFDKGNPELGIKVGFNGGLFSELLDPKLLGKPLSNYYLANALIRCSRARNPLSKELERVDFSSINYQHLGSVYEGLLQYEPEESKVAMVTVANTVEFQAIKKGATIPTGYEIVREVAKGEVFLSLKEEARKNSGSYYTPQWVVNASLDIGGLLHKIESAQSIDELSKIKICDPAMGSGHFLVEVGKRLIERARIVCNENQFQTFADLSEKLIQDCVFGVDKNKLAVMLGKLNIWFLVAESNRKLPNLDNNLKYGNSLFFNPDAKKKSSKAWFDWTGEFEKVFSDDSGFDYIVGNPPWGGNISDEKQELKILFPDVSAENLNSFDLFIRQSLRVTKDSGRVIFIVPRNLIKALDYTDLRKHISKNLAAVADIGAAFDGVTQEAVIIVISDKPCATVSAYPRLKGIESQDSNYFLEEKIPSSVMAASGSFNIYWTKDRESIRNKIENQKINTLGNLVTKSRGIEYGGNGEVGKCPNAKCKKYLTLPKKKKKSDKSCPHCGEKVTLDQLKARNYFMISKGKTEKHTLPIVAGRGIEVFGMKAGKFLEPGLPGINYKPQLFSSSEPAIFMTKICDSIKCAFASDGEYATQGVYVLKEKSEEVPLGWIAAVLNSEIFGYYHEYTVNLGAKLTTNILLDDLMKYPIPAAPDKKTLASIVKDIQVIKQSGIASDKGALAKTRIDNLVATAYGLTTKELGDVREFMSDIKQLKSYVDTQMKSLGSEIEFDSDDEDDDQEDVAANS